jgi:DNA-binding NarL/FixJ family response regulator
MPRVIRVLLVDPDATARAHVRGALAGCEDVTMVATAAGHREAVALAAETLPDVVLLDPAGSGSDGPAAIRAILGCSPASNVVVLTTGVDRTRILDAVDAGAGGYLLKDDDPAGLPPAVRAAARGESPLAPRAAGALIAGHRLPRRDERLPAVEKRVLGLLARGGTDREIAELLALTQDELDRALGIVIGALGVDDRTQAALWGQRHGYDGGDGDPGRHQGPWMRTPGRIRVSARPTGKRTDGRPQDAEGCEDRPWPGRAWRDGADARDCRVR